jgi:hypothetical protein
VCVDDDEVEAIEELLDDRARGVVGAVVDGDDLPRAPELLGGACCAVSTRARWL